MIITAASEGAHTNYIVCMDSSCCILSIAFVSFVHGVLCVLSYILIKHTPPSPLVVHFVASVSDRGSHRPRTVPVSSTEKYVRGAVSSHITRVIVVWRPVVNSRILVGNPGPCCCSVVVPGCVCLGVCSSSLKKIPGTRTLVLIPPSRQGFLYREEPGGLSVPSPWPP